MEVIGAFTSAALERVGSGMESAARSTVACACMKTTSADFDNKPQLYMA